MSFMMFIELPFWLNWICTAVGCWKTLLLFRVICRWLQQKYPWSQLGKWAIITGGTDGIGKAFAQELAARGFNVCIISRNKAKLKAVLEEIGEDYKVSTKAINADFTNSSEVYETIKASLNELDDDIGVLVNNVGMSYKYPEYFHAIPEGPQAVRDMISSNVTACTMMMHMILPVMEKRQKGVVINVSSLTAIYPMPLLAVYAASKAYVDYLSRAVHYEYKDKGIFIQSLLPGYVATKMSNRKTSLEVPSPEEFVSKAIKTVGFESYSYGYVSHKIRGFVHEWLRAHVPSCINLAIAMHYMSNGRQSYFRKLEKKKAGQKMSQS